MPRRHLRAPDEWDDRLWLSIAVASCYFIFQVTFMFVVTTSRDSCMYAFWLPHESQPLSPYWLTVAVVVGLLAWALFGAWRTIGRKTDRTSFFLYYAIAIAIISTWMYGMDGLWDAMRYERGQISAQEYYASFPFRISELKQCRGI